MASILKATSEQIFALAMSRRLVLHYTPEAERALQRLGGNFAQLLNVVRENKIKETANGLTIEGRLTNDTPVVISARPFNDISTITKEVRIGLFVWDIEAAGGALSVPKRSA